jgi:uncharacterized protein
MSHVPHELAEEFPDHKDAIHNLKLTDQHFVKLIEEYHDVNREIHRVETNVTPMADEFEKQLRRKRLALKDEIFTYLK